MNRAGFTRALLLIGILAILSTVVMAQNPVVDWNRIASTTIITNGATAANVTKTAPGAITSGRCLQRR
jgi:hypothetical protein